MAADRDELISSSSDLRGNGGGHARKVRRTAHFDMKRTEEDFRRTACHIDRHTCTWMRGVHGVHVCLKPQTCRRLPAEYQLSGACHAALNGDGTFMQRHRFIRDCMRVQVESVVRR
jgi:hypothetical protein